MLWQVGMGWDHTAVATPIDCRVRCGPYAYMEKVYEGNTVTKGSEPPTTMMPDDTQRFGPNYPNWPNEGGAGGKKRYSESFYYKWFCSRVYIAKECIVHDYGENPPPNVDSKIIFPEDPEGDLFKCYRTWRWGRESRNLGNKEDEYNSFIEFPNYIHCFRYSPEKRNENNAPPFPAQEMWEAGLPKNFPPGNEESQFPRIAPWYYFSPYIPNTEEEATCFRNPKTDEDLDLIAEKLNICSNGLFDSPKSCTLLFYYEAWGGHKAFRRTGSQGNQYGEPRPNGPIEFNFISGTPIPPIKTQSEEGRDYWLTVFAM